MKHRLCEVRGGGSFRRLFAKEKHGFFRCRSCQMITVNPPPTSEVLGGIYGTRHYHAWGVQTGQTGPARSRSLRFGPMVSVGPTLIRVADFCSALRLPPHCSPFLHIAKT